MRLQVYDGKALAQSCSATFAPDLCRHLMHDLGPPPWSTAVLDAGCRRLAGGPRRRLEEASTNVAINFLRSLTAEATMRQATMGLHGAVGTSAEESLQGGAPVGPAPLGMRQLGAAWLPTAPAAPVLPTAPPVPTLPPPAAPVLPMALPAAPAAPAAWVAPAPLVVATLPQPPPPPLGLAPMGRLPAAATTTVVTTSTHTTTTQQAAPWAAMPLVGTKAKLMANARQAKWFEEAQRVEKRKPPAIVEASTNSAIELIGFSKPLPRSPHSSSLLWLVLVCGAFAAAAVMYLWRDAAQADRVVFVQDAERGVE